MGEKIYTLRMDEAVFEKVKQSAESNRRSIAKEIEHIIALHFDDKKCPDYENTYNSEEVDKLFTRLVQIMNEHGAISGKLLPPADK